MDLEDAPTKFSKKFKISRILTKNRQFMTHFQKIITLFAAVKNYSCSVYTFLKYVSFISKNKIHGQPSRLPEIGRKQFLYNENFDFIKYLFANETSIL